MMSELRWALLIAGVVFIAVLAWWERRRPRQASGALPRAAPREVAGGREAHPVREPPLTLPSVRAREPLGAPGLPVLELPDEPQGVPVLDAAPPPEPVPEPETAWLPEPAEVPERAAAAEPPAVRESAEPPIVAPELRAAAPGPAVRETLPELPAAPPPLVQWPGDRERRILAVRLVAPGERFAGRSLRQALAAEGFVLGQFAIFHKPDEEQRAILSAANLTRPGTFDMQTMDSQHYGGLSLFAVLPGPKSPPQAFEELVFAARNLNERLHGVLQDERGSPLTPARIAQLREQLRAGTAS
jgi:cell division protein ZipA